MRKEQKTALVAEITEGLGRASIALVSEYRGITAGEATEVRRKIRAVQGELRVAKNTLIRRAVKDTAYSMLDDQLGGPVGLILSFADPVELAKTVTGMRELGEKFKVRGGVLDGKPLTAEEIQALAALPPREVVLGQLLGLLMAPATQVVRLLNEPGSALARVVDAIGKKNGDPAPAAGSAAPPTAAPAAPTDAAPGDASPTDTAPSEN
jgi:large subunit ribosomal protein L10